MFLRPKTEDRCLFDVGENDILKLIKPLYSLYDSGDYWYATIDRHLTKDLGMERAMSDFTLNFRFQNGNLTALTVN